MVLLPGWVPDKTGKKKQDIDFLLEPYYYGRTYSNVILWVSRNLIITLSYQEMLRLH